jgi:hypothetical protein
MGFAAFSFSIAGPPAPGAGTTPGADGYTFRQFDDLGDLGVQPGEFDVKNTALQLLWKQYEDKPNFVGFATAIGCAQRPIELLQDQLRTARTVAGAIGVALDELGAGVDLPRNGLADDSYRAAIRAQTRSLTASGTLPEIASIIADLELGEAVTVAELYPAGLLITVGTVTQGELQTIQYILANVPAAGVGTNLEATDPGSMDGFASISDPVSPPAGYAEFSSISGGVPFVPLFPFTSSHAV